MWGNMIKLEQQVEDILKHFGNYPSVIHDGEQRDEATFILYSSELNIQKLLSFSQKIKDTLTLIDVWQNSYHCIALLKSGCTIDKLIQLAHSFQLDIAKVAPQPQLEQSGLLVMDMDSTAIEMECIDEIAKLAGTGKLVSEITERAMQGELDFSESLRHRVGTLKDSPESILQQVREQLPLMPGLKELIKGLKKYGWKTAIASGGFTYFADHLKELLQLDAAVSNQFDIVDGYLTGKVLGDIVDANYKAKTLTNLAHKFNIPVENSVAVGDGANDLAMMSVAGLGIAYHAKPKVQQQAQVVVNFSDLTALLTILEANSRYSKLK